MHFDLHIHSWHSKQKIVPFDGLDSPEILIKTAITKGFSGIAITDHDTLKGFFEAKKYCKDNGIKEFILIPGIETSTAKGHIVGLGIEEEIPVGLSPEEAIDLIHKAGGIAIAAHPFDVARKGVGKLVTNLDFDAIEILNGHNADRISNIRARKAADKLKKIKLVGSDAHMAEEIGFSMTNIEDVETVDDVLKKIKKGEITISGKTIPVSLIKKLGINRLRKSYEAVSVYVEKNYYTPKRQVARILLSTLNHNSKMIDILYTGFTVVSWVSVFTISSLRYILSA